MSIQDIASYLNKKGCKLNGCTKAEVAKIEEFYGVKLPSSYVDFLLLMGKEAGEFMKGSSVFYDEIFNIHEGAVELLADDGFKELPKNAFVFFMHQGYQFAFFICEGEDNPPVFYYYEKRTLNDFENIEKSFIEFLESHLAG